MQWMYVSQQIVPFQQFEPNRRQDATEILKDLEKVPPVDLGDS